MTTKKRIEKLEQVKQTGEKRIVIWSDALDVNGLVTFEGVKMPQSEAEAKAAALPDSVTVIHVIHASNDITIELPQKAE